jgi:hypothetical protein
MPIRLIDVLHIEVVTIETAQHVRNVRRNLSLPPSFVHTHSSSFFHAARPPARRFGVSAIPSVRRHDA